MREPYFCHPSTPLGLKRRLDREWGPILIYIMLPVFLTLLPLMPQGALVLPHGPGSSWHGGAKGREWVNPVGGEFLCWKGGYMGMVQEENIGILFFCGFI